MSSETQIIDRIRRRIPSSARWGLRIGIGDDAAVLRPPPRADWVVTCDSFLENVHFLAEAHPAGVVGFKALARATSDMAAMGALPRFFLLSLALPAHRTGEWLNGFLAGMARAARRFRVVLAGGDTAQHATVAISITVLGEALPCGAVTRAGARPGDLLYVTGRLGAAQLGLELVLQGLHRKLPRKVVQPLLRSHFYPEVRLAVGQWLSGRRLASAMIDISDGLSTDLEHLCAASGVGARIWADRIPTVRIPPLLRNQQFDRLELALHGGEDYELLFTVPPRRQKMISSPYRGTRITPIGEIIAGKGIFIVGADGRATPLAPRGWDHFRSPAG